MLKRNDLADFQKVRNLISKQANYSQIKTAETLNNHCSKRDRLVSCYSSNKAHPVVAETQIQRPRPRSSIYNLVERAFTSMVLVFIVLAFITKPTNAASGGPCQTQCDSTFYGTTVTSPTGNTIASDTGTIMTTAYLDLVVTKPATGSYFLRALCSTSNWADCVTGQTPPSYTVSISPSTCASALYWDTGCTLPCSTALSVSNGQAFSITAKALDSTPVTGTTGTACTVSYANKNSVGSTTTSSYTFTLQILACNAYSLAWLTQSFSIADQTYYVYDSANIITASLATITNACNYQISYSLLISPSLTTAADNTVFTIVLGTPNTISISTSTYTKAGTYNLVYRAFLTNPRTGSVVKLDSNAFKVTIIDRCATATFDSTPSPALTAMSTTALSITSVTQTLNIKDSVSSVNGNSDGWTYCGNRVFTINSGPSPQTFLTITSNSLSSTMTLLSQQLSDATTCPTASPCTVTIKVCLANYATTVCTSPHPSFQVSIGPCVVTSYTVTAYPDFTYTIKTAATTTPYPTFTQSPACNYSPTKTVTVNSDAFPGINLNGGTSMSTIFTDDTTYKRFVVVDNTLLDGTNTYTFVFTSTLPVTPVVSTQSTFKIILANPCLSTIVQDSGQTITLSGTELQSTATSVYNSITQFKNSYSGTSLDSISFCGPYTYSLTGYTGTFLQFNAATPSISVLSASNTDNSASPYSIGLKACLTNYPTVPCYTKPLTVTITDCVISTYTMTIGQTALSTTSPVTYTVGATALTITFPLFTQSPACGYTETKTCYLNASPTACPSWVTTSATSFTIYCTNPTTCPAGNYDLVMKTALSNTAVTNAQQTQRVIISNPCPTATMTAGTVDDMTTSALSTTAQTQTISQWPDSASTTYGVASICGASTYTLMGTYSSTFISISGSTLTLLSTSLTDTGSHTNVQVKQCLTAYSSICATKTFTVTVTACEVTSWTPILLATQTKYIYQSISTSGYTTWTQAPACTYAYTTAVSISGYTLSDLGLYETTPNIEISYYSGDRADAGTYQLTWTFTASAQCLGVCTAAIETTSLVWKDPCQQTVLEQPVVSDQSTTALNAQSVVWTFNQVSDSISKSIDDSSSTSYGFTFCQDRTYTLSGHGSWLQLGTGSSNNQLTLLSTSLADFGVYSVTLTTSFINYADVASTQTTFTITISKCVITSLTPSANPVMQQYLLMGLAVYTSFPTFTQQPACDYEITYTCTFMIWDPTLPAPKPSLLLTDSTLTSLKNLVTCDTSNNQVQVDILSHISPAPTDLTNYQYQGDYGVSVTGSALAAPTPSSNSDFLYILRVINPCIGPLLVPQGTPSQFSVNSFIDGSVTIKDMKSSVLLATQPESQQFDAFKDDASTQYGNQDGYSLCGARVYTTTYYTWLSVSTSATDLNLNKVLVDATTVNINSGTNTRTTDAGDYTITLKAAFAIAAYQNFTTTTQFNVQISDCILTQFKERSLTDQTYIIGSSTALSISIPAYTQIPNCQYPVKYTAKFQKTAVANTNYATSTPLNTEYQLDSTAVISYLKFVAVDGLAPSGLFTVSSFQLSDGGDYSVFVTAYVTQTTADVAIDTNLNFGFGIKIEDPCFTTILNGNSLPQTIIPTLTTSVKFGQSGTTAPYSYSSVDHKFYSVLDSVSYVQGTQTSTTLNSASIFCGLRVYTLNVVGYSMPTWLNLDSVNGIIKVQTSSDSDVNFSPGYSVTLQACLEFYPTTCSDPISFIVIIQECQVVTFVIVQAFTTISLDIFDSPFHQSLQYLQTPLCGWSVYYDATITSWTLPYTGTSYPLNSAVIWGAGNQVNWSTLDQSVPEWVFHSINKDDATTFTIKQFVTLQYKISGVSLTNTKNFQFKITFTDQCTKTYLIPNALDFSTDSTKIQISIANTTVKFGTDLSTSPSGLAVTYPFNTHLDDQSNKFLSRNPSTYVCGKRVYSVSVVNNPSKNFVSITSTADFTTNPIISVLTSLDSDINTWQIKLSVQLQSYPSITLNEYFYVKIDKCVLNSFTINPLTQLNYEDTSPYTFKLYLPQPSVLTLPSYVQAPLCGYPILYKLTQTKTYNNKTGVLDDTTITSSFAFVDSTLKQINFTSQDYLDDLGIYDGFNPAQTLQMSPYQFQLKAYFDTSIINPASKVNSNDLQTFWVRPQDTCYQAKLIPDSVKNISYFMFSDSVMLYMLETNDSLSLADTGSTGYQKCGDRNYTLLQGPSWQYAPILASVLSVNKPWVRVNLKKNIQSLLGTQSISFITTLSNYPNKTAYSNFTVQVYQLSAGVPLDQKYYQVAKKELVVTWNQFTIQPTTTYFDPIVYTCQVFSEEGVLLDAQQTSWLNCTGETRQFRVFTTNMNDQGNYTVYITATVSNYTSKFSQQQGIPLRITRLAPPQQAAAAPQFTEPLIDQEMDIGDELNYKLPPIFDPTALKVKVTPKGAPAWVTYDEPSRSIIVKKGSTKSSNAGGNTFQLILENTKGGKSTYRLQITVHPQAVPDTVKFIAPKVKFPIPSITSVTSKGLMSIKWSQQMRVPRNLTLVSNGTTKYSDPNSSLESTKPNLDIQVIRGQRSDSKDLTFTWNFTSWSSQTMVIQLYFNTSTDVSQNPTAPEEIQLIFYGADFFTSVNGVPVNGGLDPQSNSVLKYKLPKQESLNKVVAVRKNNKAGMQSASVGEAIFTISYSAFLNFVWSMVDTQQIVILLPLFKIQLPPNAADFFAQLMTIAAFALIPTDPIFGVLLQNDYTNLPLPLSDNFAAVGFATTYITNNLGTVFFSLMYFPVALVAYLLLKPFPFRQMMYLRIKIGRRIFWSSTIQTIFNEYTIIATCSMIQLANLDWTTNYGTQFCSFFGILYFAITAAFPFFVAGFCWKNFGLIQSQNEAFVQKFSPLWGGLRTDDKGFVLFHWYFLFRRYSIAILCVYASNSLLLQLLGIIYNIQLSVVVAASTMCMIEEKLNPMEFFNECMIMLIVYAMMCFTDFQPDMDVRLMTGTMIKVLVMFHIGFNLTFQSVDNLLDLKQKYKRWRLYRDYAKKRAIDNVKQQKVKRHLKFKQLSQQPVGGKSKNIELNSIPEVSQDAQSSSRQQSYDYARANDSNNQISVSFENSVQDLNYGEHDQINKGIYRQPAEASQVKSNRLREFSDGATRTDAGQNSKISNVWQPDTLLSMEEHTHNKLKQKPHTDSIDVFNQEMLQEVDPFQLPNNSIQEQLQRQPAPDNLDLQPPNPLALIHQRLARMVQHDTTLPRLKVKPQPQYHGLQVQLDYDMAHQKMFKQLPISDNNQNYESQPRIVTSKRKPIVPVNTQALNSPYSDPFVSKRNSRANNSSITSLDNLVEKQDEEAKSDYEVRSDQLNKLVEELTNSDVQKSRQERPEVQQSEFQYQNLVHQKLFGFAVGKKQPSTTIDRENSNKNQSKSNLKISTQPGSPSHTWANDL